LETEFFSGVANVSKYFIFLERKLLSNFVLNNGRKKVVKRSGRQKGFPNRPLGFSSSQSPKDITP
jgi:hypothetical protein